MDNIKIKATGKTPEVSFNFDSGELQISGRSIPENSYQFYEPLLTWLDSYSEKPKGKTQLSFRLDYFNTSSSMYILGILKKLEKMHLAGNEAEVRWHYEVDDEDMLQTGEDLRQIVKIPIQMIEVESEDE